MSSGKGRMNQVKAGAVLSVLQIVIGMLLVLTYTPLMIRRLGTSEYGLYNTAWSTASLLSILSLGFNSGYIKYYTKYKQQKDEDGIARLNGLFLTIFAIIGLISMGVGLFIVAHLEWVFKTGLTAKEYHVAKILMTLLTLHVSATFPASVFAGIISAHEEFVILRLLDMGKNVLAPLCTIPLLLFGFKSVAVVVTTMLICLMINLFFVGYVLLVLRERFIFKTFEKQLFKSLFLYSIFIAVNMVIDQLNGNIDKLLLGRFHGTESVAVYSAGATLYYYVVAALMLVSGVFTPLIHRIVETTKDNQKEQRRELTDLFTKVGRVQFTLLTLLCTGFWFFGRSFIVKFWAGPGYEDAYIVALLLLIPGSVALVQDLGIEIQRALNKHKFRSVVYSIMAVVNLILTICLSQKYGAIGAAIGTAISFIVCNGIAMNIYYHKECNIDMLHFWKSIAKLSKGLPLPIFYGIIIKICFSSDKILIFLLQMTIYTLIYVVTMWFLGLNEEERQLVLSPLKQIFVGREGDENAN